MFTGIDAHRAVNLARGLQGLPWVNAPQPVLTMEAGDAVRLMAAYDQPGPPAPLLCHVDALWSRDPGPLGPNHCLMMWARPRTSAPSGLGQESRYRWCGLAEVVPDLPVRLDSILIGRPLIVAGGWISLRLGLAEVGLSPFTWRRAALRNLAE